jgi:ATP/maltotriose-dependent transcriptional regulator MalT
MDLSPRLTALVDKALDYPIAEIVAPAGFGKSTIISWLADARGFLIARIRPQAEPAFALMSALCKSVSVYSQALEATLPTAYANAERSNTICELASWFHDYLPHEKPLKIAIDDLHLLGGSDDAWTTLAHLIELTSGRVDWVLASRVRPPLPEIEWVARGYQGRPVTEKDLEFQLEDIIYVGRLAGIVLSEDSSRGIAELTRGWPLLTLYALRMLSQGYALDSVDDVIRVSGSEIIASRLLSRLSPHDVDLLAAVALYDGVNDLDLDITNPGAARQLHRLVAAGIPLSRDVNGHWRLHDLMRDHFIQRETALRAAVAERIAVKLAALNRVDEALRIAIAGKAYEVAQAVLERNARHFSDAGDRGAVRHALIAIPTSAIKRSVRLALIRGSDELHQGKPGIAAAFFRRAVEDGDDSYRAYALARLCQSLLLERRSPEAIAALRNCALEPLPKDVETACEVLRIVAWGFMWIGDVDGAQIAIAKALNLLPRVGDPLVEASVYVRAAFIAFARRRYEEANEFAKRAIEVGERKHLFDVLWRAFGVRKLVAAPSHEGEAVECARRCAQYAARMLDRFAVYSAETALFVFACRSGDLDEARSLRRRLLPVPDLLKEHVEAVVLTTAAQLAMLERDYEAAANSLRGVTVFGLSTAEPKFMETRRVFFGANLTLLCQLQDDSRGALTHCHETLMWCADLEMKGIELAAAPELEVAKITCAAILGLNGKMSEAEAILADQARDAHEQYRRDLAAWVAAALVDPSAEPSQEAVTRANGIIILLRRAITAAQKQAVSLTPAESRVLRSLSEGRASKEIAAMTGRSVKTVDNQIAAILRKLGARSRGEAVARARRVGLLQGEPAESVRA